MTLPIVLLLIAGLVLLVWGAELLVRGASRIATAVGISPLVVGLTVVAFGTSSPELAVSVMSAFKGQTDLALGNIVGSNIFNVLLILGVSAMIIPLIVARQLVRFDVPVMIVISFLVLIFGYDGKIGRLDGFILFSGAIAYTVFLIRQSRKESSAAAAAGLQEAIADEPSAPLWKNILLVVIGLVGLILGSKWLVSSAITIAQHFGVSEMVIGLTIVAAGTSMPEVATSVVAAIRGERDIAVGNVVGSNIFNILSVLGLSSLISPTGIEVSSVALHFDIPVMIAVAVACLPIFFTGYLITRWNGIALFGFYLVYLAYLILTATQSEGLSTLRDTMVYFILPLTALTLIFFAAREFKGRSLKA